MFVQDTLISIFQFLDWSHIPTSSLVCSDWNMACNSVRLWEYYFRMMAGPSWSSLLSSKLRHSHEFNVGIYNNRDDGDDDEFSNPFKNLIRDEFSNLNQIRHDTIIISDPKELDLSIATVFDNSFLQQFVIFTMGRMVVKEIHCGYFAQDYIQLFDTHLFSELDFDTFEVKLVFEILGIGKFVLRRNFSFDMDYFGYSQYAKNFFIYLTTVEEDSKNFKPTELFDSGRDYKNAFVFREQDDKYEIINEHVLLDLLKQLVPDLKQLGLSPSNFEPILFMIFERVLSWFGCTRPFKEAFKYPNNYSNPLIRSILAKKCHEKVQKILSVLERPIFKKVNELLRTEPNKKNYEATLNSAIIEMEYNLPKRVRKMGLYTSNYSSITSRIQNVKAFLSLMNYDMVMERYIKYGCDP